MKKTKLISGFIILLLILTTMLTGCKTNKIVVLADTLKTVDLTWYLIGGGAPKDADIVNKEISTYLKTKINANLNIKMFDWGSYDTKVGTMIAAGEPCDIVFTCGWALPFRANADKGSFLPLDDMLKLYGKNILKVLPGSTLIGGQYKGVQYGIPINKDTAHSQGFQFNKNMVEKYKFDISKVKSLADIEPMLKIIKEKEVSQGTIVTNLSAGTNTGSGPMVLLDFDNLSGDTNVPFGLLSNNDTGNTKIVNEFDTPEAMAILKTTREFYNLGYVRKDAPTMKSDPSIQEGKPFVSIAQLKPNGDIESSTPKAPRVQVSITDPISATGDVTNSMVAISKTSENPERAMMLLDLMYSDEKLVNLATLGIEGKHYTKVDANTYEIGKDQAPLYSGSIVWMFGNQFLDYLKTSEPKDKWETLDAFNKSSTPLNSLGFYFDPSSVQTEMAAMVNVTKEYQPVIVTGSVDPDVYVPKYNNALKAAGMDAVITEMQTQYDAFLAAKKK